MKDAEDGAMLHWWQGRRWWEWLFLGWVLSLVIGTFIEYWILGIDRNREPNICSLEYREIYLLTHDSDAVLAKECPFEPWYRNR
jgi:hypothetical protein